MDKDTRQSAAVIGGIIVLALLCLGYLFLSGKDDRPIADENATPSWMEAPAATSGAPVDAKVIITAKHWYKDGVHTLAGEISVPSPCHIVEGHTSASADGMQSFLELSSSVKTGEMCAQVITPARFKVSQKADKNTSWSATLNSAPVTLNLIEAGPNEDPDDFELYIKG